MAGFAFKQKVSTIVQSSGILTASFSPNTVAGNMVILYATQIGTDGGGTPTDFVTPTGYTLIHSTSTHRTWCAFRAQSPSVSSIAVQGASLDQAELIAHEMTGFGAATLGQITWRDNQTATTALTSGSLTTSSAGGDSPQAYIAGIFNNFKTQIGSASLTIATIGTPTGGFAGEGTEGHNYAGTAVSSVYTLYIYDILAQTTYSTFTAGATSSQSYAYDSIAFNLNPQQWIGKVGQNGDGGGGGPLTVTWTGGGTNIAGSTVVLHWATQQQSATAPTTPTGYTLITSLGDTNGSAFYYYRDNCPAISSQAISYTGALVCMDMIELAGTYGLDGFSSVGSANTTTPTSGSLTTTNATDILLGCFSARSSNGVPRALVPTTTGYTLVQPQNSTDDGIPLSTVSMIEAYLVVGAVQTSITVSCSCSPSGGSKAVLLTFKQGTPPAAGFCSMPLMGVGK